MAVFRSRERVWGGGRHPTSQKGRVIWETGGGPILVSVLESHWLC